MKKYFFIQAAVLFCVLCPFLSTAIAEEDLFGEYRADMRKDADAKDTNVYKAYGENMANLIESGRKEGIVITGEGEWADGKVHADGAGNVVVDKDANVKGPIINKTKIENTTVIIKDSSNRSKY